MHLDAEISRMGRNLVFSRGPHEQREALQALWLNGSPEALKMMAQSLKSPKVQIKDEILGYLSFRDLEVVYKTLVTVLDEADDDVRSDLLEIIDKLDLKVRYIEKIKRLRDDTARYGLLALMIRFVGKLRDREVMDELGHLIDIEADEIRLALIDALELAETGTCPDYIFDSMKLFSPTVSGRALDLIADLQDTSSVPSILSMLSEADESTRDKIFSVLKQFDYQDLVKTVKNTLVESGGVPDLDLFRGWVMFLEIIGKQDKAVVIRKTVGLEPVKKIDETTEAKKILAFEVSCVSGCVVLGLNGKLSMHSLPGFKRTLTFIIKNGYTRIILQCGYLLSIDHHSIAFLEQTNKRLRQELGGIKYLHFHALNEFQRQTLMPSAELYKDMTTAINSFTGIEAPSVLKIDETLFPADTPLEVTYWQGKLEKIRAATVRDYNEKNMTLSWEVLDDQDIFTEFVNDKVHIAFERDRDLFESKTKVISQDPIIEPYVKLLSPRIARHIDRRRYVRVACRLLVIFQKLDAKNTVQPTEYPGVCLKISETEMVIMTPVPLIEDNRIVVRVNPADLTVGKIVCRVNKITEYIQQKKRFYEYCLAYVQARDCDRSVIKTFVYNRLADDI
ncbi:MAG: HEAT repeat domain-containing protein [bacterium]|jgi:hypothetical protein|nr:HEAT repeat domain-containing protein [bacterium]